MKEPRLSNDEYARVAFLHLSNIREGFLSTLGLPFLSILYKAIDESEKGVLIVHRVDNLIVGFVSGSEGMRPIYLRLLKNFPSLLRALFPALFDAAKVKKIVELLFLQREVQSDSYQTAKAELLSIVVVPEFRGKGIALSLYQRLCRHFAQKGIVSFIITVGDDLDSAHRFYRKSGAESIGHLQVHAGVNSTLYLQNLKSVE